MRQYIIDYLNYIHSLTAEYNSHIQALIIDDRKDEADIYKIRINICDIFIRMLDATEKKVGPVKSADEAEQAGVYNQEYLDWFEKIPVNWRTNLETARKYEDAINIKTEEVKLETAELLRSKFLELAGGSVPGTR